MANVKKNISANLIGNFWQVLMGLFFIPFYIKFMGVESYGLVGIYVTLQILVGIMDMGLSTTMNREMARRSVLPDSRNEMQNLVRSLEVIYWCVAVLIGLIIIFISSFIAENWIKAENLPISTVKQAVLIMGFAMALQWPASLYVGGLHGLQRQVLLNIINMSMVTARGVGAVLILWLISPTIQAFFFWQIFISGTHTSLLAFSLKRSLPPIESKPFFEKRLIKSVGRFAVGMASITILSIILNQLDKVILSKMLSLESFGYYTLAGVVAMSPMRMAWPVFTGIYPRFTQLVSLNNYEALRELYHKACQLMAVLIIPFSVVVAFFSYELVLIWTQNPVIAEKSHLLVSILICGTIFHALLHPPHAMQMAFGWTRLLFFRNFFAVILLVPFIIYMTNIYGAIGAACVWVILNLGSVLFEIPMMHGRLLRGEKWKWCLHDVLIPLIAALLLAGTGKLLMPAGMPQWVTVIYLMIVSAVTLVGVAMVTPATKEWICAQILKVVKK